MPGTLEGALLLALAFAWYLAAEDAVRSRRLVYSLIALLILLGFMASVVGVALQRPVGHELGRGALPTAPLGAMSTWLPALVIPALLLAWTVLCFGRTRLRSWDRMGLALGMVVMLVCLLEWGDLPTVVLALAGFGVLVRLISRRAGVEFSMKTVVGIPLVMGAVVGAMLLMGDPPRAFLFDELIEGDGAVGVPPVRLGVNDRLRVFFVSLPVIWENPLLGTGWGSFGFVYPEARARFFQLNPGTILTPAPYGLLQARSDVLQLLFEAGSIGLLLAAVGVGMLLLAGWTSLRGCVRQEHVMLQLGIFVSILVLLLHALFESVFRVPSSAALILVLLAVWGNGERLWRLHVPRLEERVAGHEELDLRGSSVVALPAAPRRLWLLGIAGWSVATLLVAGAVVFLGSASGQWYSGRLLLAQAVRSIDEASVPTLDPASRRAHLYAANGSLDLARRLQPQAGDVLFQSARLQLAFAMDKMEDTDRRSPEIPDLTENLMVQSPEVLRRLALSDAQQGLMLLDAASETVRSKEYFRIRSLLLDVKAQLSDEGREDFFREAVQSLGEAVRLNPGDPEPVVQLVRWMRRSDLSTEQNVFDLYSFLYRFHPQEFESHVLGLLNRRMELGDDLEAYREARRVLSVNPVDVDLRFLRAWTAFFAGDLGTANAGAGALRSEGFQRATLLDAMIAARENAFGRALTDAQRIRPESLDVFETEQVEVFVALMRTRIPGTTMARTAALEQLKSDLALRPQALVTLARYLSVVLADHAGARGILQKMVAEHGASSNPVAWAILSDVLVRSEPRAFSLLRQLEQTAVGTPPAWERLRPVTARATITEAAGYLRRALEASDSEEDILILSGRLARLEALLPPTERLGASSPILLDDDED
jgi:O-antigen ligase/tetratricopeptide (TPR) repeat protein